MSDEPLLTTDQVRSGYSYDSRYGEFSEGDEVDFDKWLAARDAAFMRRVLDALARVESDSLNGGLLPYGKTVDAIHALA